MGLMGVFFKIWKRHTLFRHCFIFFLEKYVNLVRGYHFAQNLCLEKSFCEFEGLLFRFFCGMRLSENQLGWIFGLFDGKAMRVFWYCIFNKNFHKCVHEHIYNIVLCLNIERLALRYICCKKEDYHQV